MTAMVQSIFHHLLLLFCNVHSLREPPLFRNQVVFLRFDASNAADNLPALLTFYRDSTNPLKSTRIMNNIYLYMFIYQFYNSHRITVSSREGSSVMGVVMKRAPAESTPLRNGTGLAIPRAVDAGPRPEELALHSKPWLGAPAAVEALFDRYHGMVYGLAMSILMIQSDAEKAAQDVFLTVVRNLDRCQGNPTPQSWIYRICVNACLTRLRKGRRTETVPIEQFLPVFSKEGAHAMPVEDWSREIDRRDPDKEIGQVIGGFIEELPDKYRVVFAFREVQGFSYEETAQVLDLTTVAVKSRLHRVRLYLRERLSRYLRDRGAA